MDNYMTDLDLWTSKPIIYANRCYCISPAAMELQKYKPWSADRDLASDPSACLFGRAIVIWDGQKNEHLDHLGHFGYF